MSYNVCLIDPKINKIVTVPSHEEGGTYAVGGSTNALLNITYNYSKHFCSALESDEGIKWLRDKKASDVEHRLVAAISILGVKQNKDYWAATSGNAGYALSILLKWVKLYPNAVFHVGY
jgi:hypothetical protein